MSNLSNALRSVTFVFFACFFLGTAASAQNNDARSKFLLEAMMTERTADPSWFADSFTQQVPLEQINAIVQQIRGQMGALEKVEGSGNDWQLVFAKFLVPTQIALDSDGRIIGLFFRPPVARSDLDPASAAGDLLQSTGGQSALFVRQRSRVLVSERNRSPMAVGSAFKLAVLSLYEQQVASRQLRRRDVVELSASNKSLPTGSLQNWPDGTPITLATMAGVMISQSDNTATDMMIDVVGREDLEALSPRNTPFLKTTEAFKLKAVSSAAYRADFADANPIGRKAYLDTIAQLPMPDASELSLEPTLEIEWFFTVEELCGFAVSVIDAPAMRLNSGPVSAEGWNGVAFKGGSEAGVLNLTAAGRYKDGQTACVSFTVNTSEPIANQNELALKFGALFSSLAEN